MRRIFLVTMSVLSLGACAVPPRPIVGLTSKGATFRGAITIAGVESSTFEISTGRLTCSGLYPIVGDDKVITVTMRCNDGRSAIAIVTRETGLDDGGGTVRFSDGTEGTFAFGQGARAI